MTKFLLTRQRELTRWIRSLLVNRLRANASGPRILANSIPKAGTHLLIRCLTLLPGITDSGLEQLRPLRRLRKLGLDDTHVTDACVPLLVRFRRLTWLGVSSRSFRGEG